MKHLFLCLALSGSVAAAKAQMIWQNDICPNWTTTDINGVQHTLYDYLDDGYTVFFDISATWCPPCWDIHESKALDSLYTMYGPGTAENKVMVFLIEVDPGTGLADLQGTGTQTLGDWITDTPYPIIDDASIATLLSTPGFPFIYSVCPNRFIAQPSFGGTMAELWASAQLCNEYYLADTPNDASLLFIPNNTGCNGSTRDITVRLQNTGTTPLTSALIDVSVALHQNMGNTLNSTYQWTGNLNTYAFEDVVVAQLPLPLGMHIASTHLVTQDDFMLNNATGWGLISSVIAPGVNVSFELLTDDHGEDLFWRLYDGVSNTQIMEAPLGGYPDNTLITENWSLLDQHCYALSITDAGGNGLADPGYVRLSLNGSPFADLQDFFYNTEAIEFYTDISASVTEEPAVSALGIYPDPMEDHTTVDLSTFTGTVELTLMDASGRLVRSERVAGGGQHRLDRGTLTAGGYVVLARSASGQALRGRLVVL